MAFLNQNLYIFITLSILLNQASTSYVLLNFAKQQKLSEPVGNNFTIDNFSHFFIEPTFSTTIEIGNPPQKVELIYSSNNYGISMVEDRNSSINHSFNKNLSLSLNETHSFDSYFFGSNKPVTLIDSLFLPLYDTKLNKIIKIRVEEYPFVYLYKVEGEKIDENKGFIKEEDGKAYMIYGSRIYCNWKNEIGENLPHFLKHNKIVDSYIFNIIFSKTKEKGNEDYDFTFKIGYEPHDKDRLKVTPALSYMGEVNWILEFHNVFYFSEGFKLNINNYIDDFNQISFNEHLNGKKIYSNNDRGQMAFDMDIILCPKFFYFSINKTYFGNHTNQCKIQRSKSKYSIFVCDKDFNTDNFPTIYFYHKDLNYTFVLTQKELFKVIGDKKYFLIVYDLYRPQFWMLGKIFLEKYSFNYDMENRLIGFYQKISYENNHKENNNYILLLINIILLGIVLIIAIIAFYIGKYLCNKMRKKRANEMDDNFDYQINEDNSEKGNKNYEDRINIDNNDELDYNKIVF